MNEMKTGIEIIATERKRQIEMEGWSAEHDAQYTDESLASAAACYAMPEKQRNSYAYSPVYKFNPHWWPLSWELSWWKPTPNDRVRELAKAGALIAAEIDRLNTISK